MPSVRAWKLSRRPNYIASLDKKYPYSEVPYIGEYHLLKLPFDEKLTEHIDYWGEGRIETTQGASGFRDCYNVNHQYQLVSNGLDRDKKIPNRIPVISYTNCDTSAYIRDNSVRTATVMGAPINKSCAQDIARMINSEEGKVVVYGFDENSADVKNIEESLQKRGLIFCYKYELPQNLIGLTLFDSHRAYLNLREIAAELQSNVTEASMEKAVEITHNCIKTGNRKTVSEAIENLLRDGAKNLLQFAHKVWTADKDIVISSFPKPFKLILNSDKVRIINRLHNIPLKLDTETDAVGDRLAWGDGVESPKERLLWKFVPVIENDKVVFKIENIEFSMCLKLDAKADAYGDRLCWGNGRSVDTARLSFTVETAMKDGRVLVVMFSQEFGQCLKLDASTDSYGNRKLWGNDYFVNEDYDRFGWYVESDD